ncbi:hypothetical protein TgHK011_009294 [Trichoderma gracile]|nr:hypothetical protein TgHK011_009294 [Trichoderma gracile]
MFIAAHLSASNVEGGSRLVTLAMLAAGQTHPSSPVILNIAHGGDEDEDEDDAGDDDDDDDDGEASDEMPAHARKGGQRRCYG